MDRYGVLTQARRELGAMESEHEQLGLRTSRDGLAVSCGRVAEACRRAEHSIFEALNALAHHADDKAALLAIETFYADPEEVEA